MMVGSRLSRFLGITIALAAAAEGGGGGASAEGGADGEGASTDFLAGFSGEGHADFVTEQGWKSGDEMVSAYKAQAESMKGLVRIPGEDASDDDKAAYRKALGVPDNADGYEFQVPKDMPEGLTYDNDLAAKFKAKSHELGLTPDQAQGLHDMQMEHMTGSLEGYQKQMADQAAEREAEVSAKADAAHEALIKDWGKEGSESYNKNLALANRALAAGGEELKAEFADKGVFGEDGAVLMPEFAKLLAKHGHALYGEASPEGGSAGADNPFAEGSVNRTKQIELIRNQPDRARTLIRAAGKDPKTFKL